MNQADRDDIGHAISQTMAFYGKELDALQMRLWLRAVAEKDPTRIKRALADYTGQGRYAPKPVDIIELAESYVETERRALPPPQASVEPASPEVARAWCIVIRMWEMGDMFRIGDVDPDELDQALEICNHQAKRNDNPESIPPEAWLDVVWGAPRDQVLLSMGLAA